MYYLALRGSGLEGVFDLGFDLVAAGDAEAHLLDVPLAVEDESGRQGAHVVGVIDVPVAVEEHRVSRPQFRGEVLDRVDRLLPVHPQDHHRVAFVNPGLVLEIGYLGPTGDAPGGPEVEHHHLAAVVGEAVAGAVEAFDGEVGGGGAAGGGGRPETGQGATGQGERRPNYQPEWDSHQTSLVS